jgi:hypothetical protein
MSAAWQPLAEGLSSKSKSLKIFILDLPEIDMPFASIAR